MRGKAFYFFKDAVHRAQLVLILVLVFGILYVGFGVIGSSTFRNPYEVTLQVPQSAGLFKGSMVSYRGQQVGKVLNVKLTKTGIDVILQINRNVKVPQDVKAEIHNLSPVGEQYVDLQPRTDQGPFLNDDSVIAAENAEIPIHISQLFDQLDDLTGNISSQDLTTVVEQAAIGFGGTANDLAAIFDNSDRLVNTLEKLRPQTVSLLNNSRVTLDTMVDFGDEFVRFASSVRQVTAQLKESDPKLREVMDRSLVALKEIDAIFRENETAAAALFRHMVVVSDVLARRVPALEFGFIQLPLAGDALQGIVYPDGLRGKVMIGDVETCTYVPATERESPVTADRQPNNLNNHCTNPEPGSQVRGSENAPRP